MQTVAFHTLGCRLNMAETALAADDLRRHGYAVVELQEGGVSPDILVVNSCAVTGAASQKTRQIVRQLRRRHPAAFLVLMGCDARLDRTAWEKTDAAPDMVVPHPSPGPLSRLLADVPAEGRKRRFVPEGAGEEGFRIAGAARFAERTRANLKIQDGCDFACTYCAIPSARGPSRSRDAADIFRETSELAAAGYREIVLCGVNLTMYGNSGLQLPELLEELACRFPAVRLRLGSAEPGEVIPRVVQVMKRRKNVCRFLHLPLQYGNDRILTAMGRLYSMAEYRSMVDNAAAEIPDICLGADVIVGFPGETEDDFEECRAYLAESPLSLLHVFPFSPRPGTVAAKMTGRPAAAEVAHRVRMLLALAREKAENFARRQIGKNAEVILEESDPPSGWTDHYLHITMPSGAGHSRNDCVQVRCEEILGNREMRGVILPLSGREDAGGGQQ